MKMLTLVPELYQADQEQEVIYIYIYNMGKITLQFFTTNLRRSTIN